MKTVLANTISTLAMREDKNCPCETMLLHCGNNTGNVCFADALFSQLGNPEEIDCLTIADHEGEGVFVLPSSNWINADGWALHKVFLPLQGKNVKLAAAGIGIQGADTETPSDIVAKLSQDTISALKILSEHSVSIGVRGETTADVLAKLGIHNCRVIGCPSFYEPFRKGGGVNYKMHCGEITMDKTVCGITPGMKDIHKVLELAYEAKNILMLQMMTDLPLTALENKDITQQHIDSRFPNLKLSPTELKTYIRNAGKIFYTRKDWSDYLLKEHISFAWGTRFHGNMMAFTNGIPALWVMHDARTKELIEAMNLPYITKEELMEARSVEELADKCRYEKAFWESYKKLSLQYVDFLNENGIEHTFTV